MGNRLFSLPNGKPDISTELNDLGTFKNKFPGKFLFRLNLYCLATGDLSKLDTVNNPWFVDEILNYSLVNNDISILPALKKIASSPRFNESTRQRSSEIMEIMEEQALIRDKEKDLSPKTEKEKIENARRILTGARYPQTTEILRLLRDKSIVLNKLALCLIGKFKMSDMTPEVCECLNIRSLEEDAFLVLKSIGGDAVNELGRFFLTSSGNLTTSKAVLRLIALNSYGQNLSLLVERLWSNSRQLKELSLNELIKCNYRIKEEEKRRLGSSLYELFGLLTWILYAKESLLAANDKILVAEINKEYIRWIAFVRKLLFLIYAGNSNEAGVLKIQDENKDDISQAVPELAEIFFGDTINAKPADSVDFTTEKKKLKKLQRYFPGEIPEYKVLLDDIINFDYNLIGIWTKACAIRNIQKIDDGDLGESVAALLFSPEDMLREEAARLIFRSGKDFYRTISERIPESERIRLDNIVSGKLNDYELIFEKVKFMSGCFAGIQECDLISLAERLLFIKGEQSDILDDSTGFLLWSFTPDNQKSGLFIHYEGEDIYDILNKVQNTGSFFYVLPMDAVEEFRFQYPESSFTIFEYIDKHEE